MQNACLVNTGIRHLDTGKSSALRNTGARLYLNVVYPLL